MKERLWVAALAAGSLALFYVLFFPKPSPAARDLVRPLSRESRPEGYLAVWRWLGEQGVPALSLRSRYDRLPALTPRSTGNLLIVTMPQGVPPRESELADLGAWVGHGNTLLVMAALADTPGWILEGDPLFTERLTRMTGLHFEAARFERMDLAALTAERLELEPRGAHALLEGVRHITAVSTLPPRRSSRRTADDPLVLELARRTDHGDPALWLERRDAGQIILCGVASPFSNAAVGLEDNARLLANIVGWSLGEGGAVIFDDAHQGDSAWYDGRAFFADPRLHRTLAWIGVVWLVFVLGALPLHAVRQPWQVVDETTYLEASARYLAAVVEPPEVAQQLIERFLAGFGERRGRAPGGGLWAAFDAHAGVSDSQRSALRAAYARACAGAPVDLVALQNLLSQLRRMVA